MDCPIIDTNLSSGIYIARHLIEIDYPAMILQHPGAVIHERKHDAGFMYSFRLDGEQFPGYGELLPPRMVQCHPYVRGTAIE